MIWKAAKGVFVTMTNSKNDETHRTGKEKSSKEVRRPSKIRVDHPSGKGCQEEGDERQPHNVLHIIHFQQMASRLLHRAWVTITIVQQWLLLCVEHDLRKRSTKIRSQVIVQWR